MPVADIPTLPLGALAMSTILLLTIPVAAIPTSQGQGKPTRTPSTTEPLPSSSTPKPKPEIDPLRTVTPVVSFAAAIARVEFPGRGKPGLLIVKPARSIVTKLAVIVRHVPLELVKVRLLTSLYEPC